MAVPQSLRDTFPETWLPALEPWCVPTASIALDETDARVLGSFCGSYCWETGTLRDRFFSDALLAWIDDALRDMPDGVMPRSSWCSWKASLLTNTPCRTRDEVLRVITTDDPRQGAGLAAMATADIPVHLHLRAWRDIPPWAEFRAFLRDGAVLGVSQYHWQDTFPELLRDPDAVRATFRAALPPLLQAMPVPTCVLDLRLRGDGLRVIELNPFGPMTGGCLFAWDRAGDFDGSLRLRDGGGLRRLPLDLPA